jgi:hypothetical protein
MSGERVPYHLRPNKFVERALFVELLSHINAVHPIADYVYVGFGGPYLEDFKILHQHFGIKNMLSLEQEEWVFYRQQFNIPYSAVSCKRQTSSEFIEAFDETMRSYGKNRRALIWLDYAAAGELRAQMGEVRSLIPRLQANDLLKITLNANPTVLGQRATPAERLAELRLRLGDLLPEGITEENITHKEYPRVLLRTLEAQAKTAAGETQDLMFQPIANYVYADTHQMLTVTGIIVPRADHASLLRESRLDNFALGMTNWKDYHYINVPYLSIREKLTLDAVLFTRKRNAERTESLSKKLTLAKTRAETVKLIKAYTLFYRFYPHYHRVQY